MKKLICSLLAVCCALTLCVAAGCGGNGGNNNDIDALLKQIDVTADDEYAGELVILTTNEASEVLTMESLIKAFNEKYPYIRVTHRTEVLDGYYNGLTNNTGVAIQTGDHSLMPDVFWLSQDFLQSIYDQEDILFPLYRIDEKDDGFSENVFADEALAVSKANNNLYMIPRDYNQVVMYFNEKIFDAAKVAYPKPQMSKDEFIQMLAALRAGLDASDEVNDYGVPYKTAVTNLVDVNALWDSWVWPLLKGFGAQVVTPDGQVALDSQETFNAVSFWKSLRKNNYVGSVSTTNAGVDFRMQQAAIYFHARATLTDITSSTKQIRGVQKLGVTALPQFGEKYAIGGGSSGYAMYLNAEHKTEAWLFLKFVASEAGQNAFCSTGNGVPSIKSLLSDDNAVWRTYTSPAFGDAFDNDAFVYGMDFEEKPFTSIHDYTRYIPASVQEDVLVSLRTCFAAIDGDASSDDELKANITNQAGLIDYLIKQAQNKK